MPIVSVCDGMGCGGLSRWGGGRAVRRFAVALDVVWGGGNNNFFYFLLAVAGKLHV